MESMFGSKLNVTIFGTSHGPEIGTVVKGFPKGEPVDMDRLRLFLSRRAPGRSALTTPRRETDEPIVLSGIEDGKTTGEEIRIIFRNENTRSGDYTPFARIPRPNHADFTAPLRYGKEVDMRGGGHFSGRLTAPLCAAGGLAMQFLAARGIRIGGHILQIGPVRDSSFDPVEIDTRTLDRLCALTFPVLDPAAEEAMKKVIEEARDAQDSVGGIVECAVTGLPAGLGDPMFAGIENRISSAVFGIPAVKAVAFGAGEAFASMHGSEANDAFVLRDGRIRTQTNHCGGILGGISTGMPVLFTAAFKPTPSIGQPQKSVDLEEMRETVLQIKGRHDPCVVARAVPCVEAAAACSVMDLFLGNE